MITKVFVPFEQFRKAVAERLNIEESKIEKEALWVKDIGISSVDLVKIVMLIRQKFGVKVSTTVIGKIKTVEDAYKLVEGEQ